MTKKTLVYLAGPMRGLPEYNFPAFYKAARDIRSLGYEVWSPAENDCIADGFDPAKDKAREMSHYMKRDLPAVCDADEVWVLPGWEKSQGAKLEVHVARALGKPVMCYVGMGEPIVRLSAIAEHVPQAVMVYAGVGATSRTFNATLPTDSAARKDLPLARGCLDYFPAALAAVASLSSTGNKQHNPGEEMHWARGKSSDHADCILRHLIERGGLDSDGVSHTAKVAWRALALLQIELERAGAPVARGAKA